MEATPALAERELQGRESVLVSNAKLPWSKSGAFAELPGESALVTESVGKGNLDDGVTQLKHGFSCLLSVRAQYQFAGRDPRGLHGAIGIVSG